MPITFGSVGDIIAVCLLVKDCAEALSDTNGSSAEYQAVIRELYVLEKALLEIGVLTRTHATTPELKSLFTSIATTVDQCRKSLEAFRAKTKTYDTYLAQGCGKSAAQRVFAGSAKKILWQVKMKDEIARFRAELIAHSISIDQLLAAATMHTVKAQTDRTAKLFDKQDKQLKDLQSRLDAVNQRVAGGNNLLMTLVRTARADWLMHLGQELKSLMCKIMITNLVTFAAVDRLQASVIEIQRSLPALERPLSNDRMCYLEDAIGRISTIPLDFIISWDAFLGVIESRFQGKPGIQKVLKKEYALQNRATGVDVNISQDWESVFLPGLWFDMDMIFQVFQDDAHTDETGDTCPRCHEKSNQPPGLKIKCSICKQVYQRVAEVTSDDNTPLSSTMHTHAPDAPESFIISPPSKIRPIIHPVPPSRPAKRKREDDLEENPSSFQRVRIKTKRRKLSKFPSEQSVQMKKRLLDDIMDVDMPTESPKRTKYPSSKDEPQDYSYEPAQDVRGNKAQAVSKPLSSSTSTPETDFNRAIGMQNPESFSAGSKEETSNTKPRNKVYDAAHPMQSYEGYPYENCSLHDHPPPNYSIESEDSEDCSSPKLDRDSELFLMRDEQPSPDSHSRRPSTPDHLASLEPSKSSEFSAKGRDIKSRVATEEQARKAGIPAGYSYKHWDPDEEPIMLLGSVFDAYSLGKWIYDWTVYYQGPATPLAEMAGDLWLLLIQLSGKIKRAEEILPKIRCNDSFELVEDFLDSGKRLWMRFAKLLKRCEDYMWEAAKKENGGKKPVSMGKSSGSEFVNSIFGRDRELEKTEKLMIGMRLWNMRFDTNCDTILREPSA